MFAGFREHEVRRNPYHMELKYLLTLVSYHGKGENGGVKKKCLTPPFFYANLAK